MPGFQFRQPPGFRVTGCTLSLRRTSNATLQFNIVQVTYVTCAGAMGGRVGGWQGAIIHFASEAAAWTQGARSSNRCSMYVALQEGFILFLPFMPCPGHHCRRLLLLFAFTSARLLLLPSTLHRPPPHRPTPPHTAPHRPTPPHTAPPPHTGRSVPQDQPAPARELYMRVPGTEPVATRRRWYRTEQNCRSR